MSSPDCRACGLACSESSVAPQESWRCSNSTYRAESGAVRDVTCRNDGCTACLTDSVCGWVGVAVAEESAEEEKYRLECRTMHGCGRRLKFFRRRFCVLIDGEGDVVNLYKYAVKIHTRYRRRRCLGPSGLRNNLWIPHRSIEANMSRSAVLDETVNMQ